MCPLLGQGVVGACVERCAHAALKKLSSCVYEYVLDHNAAKLS